MGRGDSKNSAVEQILYGQTPPRLLMDKQAKPLDDANHRQFLTELRDGDHVEMLVDEAFLERLEDAGAAGPQLREVWQRAQVTTPGHDLYVPVAVHKILFPMDDATEVSGEEWVLVRDTEPGPNVDSSPELVGKGRKIPIQSARLRQPQNVYLM